MIEVKVVIFSPLYSSLLLGTNTSISLTYKLHNVFVYPGPVVSLRCVVVSFRPSQMTCSVRSLQDLHLEALVCYYLYPHLLPILIQ